MSGFSPSSSACATAPCAACCRGARRKDDDLSRAGASRIRALAGRQRPLDAAAPPAVAAGAPSGRVASDCAQRARRLAPVLQRFDRYREALPSARAAEDLSELGDKPGDAPSNKPCLTRLPVDAGRLGAALGMPPGTLQPADLRNDDTGFRAAMYRDDETGKLILVPRDTQPDSLADWQANTRNGMGRDTPQYRSMRSLTSRLAANGPEFDIAGYSKGGGMAQEGGLISGRSQIRVFNSAGLPDAALRWTSQSDFDSLASRTKAFSADGDFLTFMNGTTDPGQNIINAHYLRTELAGEGSLAAPIRITTRNPSTRGRPDPLLAGARSGYLGELDEQIDSMQSAFDSGASVAGFPPVRAASQEIIAGSSTWLGDLLGADSDQPRLGKLNQHRMSVVLDALESNVERDRGALQDFIKRCG